MEQIQKNRENSLNLKMIYLKQNIKTIKLELNYFNKDTDKYYYEFLLRSLDTDTFLLKIIKENIEIQSNK